MPLKKRKICLEESKIYRIKSEDLMKYGCKAWKLIVKDLEVKTGKI